VPSYRYERLPIQDGSFLAFEDPNSHMTIGAMLVFEGGPLATPEGGLDIERLRAYIASRLHQIPRYRQRLDWVPLEGHPVWVDDDHFMIGYHVRHTALPRPGDERVLKHLTARVMSQQLDRGKPLWEAWAVEGLESGRFALIMKSHHCMTDGIGAVDLATVLLSPSPDDTIDEAPRWTPRPAPSGRDLLRDELWRLARMPLAAASLVRRGLGVEGGLVRTIGDELAPIWELARAGMRGAADTPLNRPIGPHRRIDWRTIPLDRVKAVKNRLGGTVNDVVLATVAGALRRFFRRRRVPLDGLDFRTVVPVSVRGADERGQMNNRASAWILSLPLAERDARRRYNHVRETTEHLKRTRQERGAQILAELSELAGSLTFLHVGVRLMQVVNPYNLIVTNVPGPPVPLYLLGARMIAGYPIVPLFENQGLGVAIASYDDNLFWGFNADWDLVPDLNRFANDVETSFEELHALATTTEVRTLTGRRQTSG
jgi:diacylglycerol O-acyltransferase / wax synthase